MSDHEKTASETSKGNVILPAPSVEALNPISRKAHLRRKVEQFRLGQWSQFRKRELALLYPARVVLQTAREATRNKVFVRASSLAFFTVLALVPLGALAGSLLLAFGSSDGKSILQDLQQHLLPVAGERITQFVLQAIENATDAGLGAVGALGLIVTAVALFIQIEQVFNDLWRVEKRRPFRVRVLLFYTLITVGPLLLSLSMYKAAAVTANMGQFGFLGSLANHATPLVLSAGTFLLAFRLLPNTKVGWLHALSAAVVTSLIFELAKFGFNLYVSQVLATGYSAIYGPVGVIPVFLLWVYISWTVVLLGAQMAYCSQNLRTLMIDDKIERKMVDPLRNAFIGSSMLGVELFTPIARGFARAQLPVATRRICVESGYHFRIVEEGLTRLENAGLVLRAEVGEQLGYIPAKPLGDIPLHALIEAFELDSHKPEVVRGVAEVLHTLRQAQSLSVKGLTAEVLSR
ncbi:MAG: hypothetical protein AUK47_06095 [Deltaproteobacteria bacterium CG2_30_63_29]|nr:MAG: hypothetical protein AUK47_06095 [Deltaproteobacteria bacterium CG2_30_63_29]